MQSQSNIEVHSLPCPPAAEVKEALAKLPPGLPAVLYSLAELADTGGSGQFKVVLDERQHPAISVLAAELSDFQGPALCISIPGASDRQEFH